MNILMSYTLKYLRLNRKRTAVTILGVVLSSALICGVFLLGVSFQRLMIDHELATSGNWHARFVGVPYAKANAITDNSAVQTAMFSTSLGSATYGSQNNVRPYLYVTAYDAPSFQNQAVKLVAGRFPQTANELLVSRVMVEDSGLGIKPGSTLNLAFGKRDFPDYDGKVQAWGGEEFVHLEDGETFTSSASKTYTVVGIMEPLFDETSMFAAFPALTLLDPTQLAAIDTVDIAILARDPRAINQIAPEIAQRAGLVVTTDTNSDVRQKSILYNEDLLTWMGGSGRSNFVAFFLAVIATLVVLIMGGSALAIYNAFAISINERKRQFGMFASVGATAAQIRRIVLIEAGIIAAIGIPIGIMAAIVGVAMVLQFTQDIVAQLIVDANEGMHLVVSPLVIALTVVFAAATVLLSAWVPARRAAQVSPIDAIRQSGAIEVGKPRKRRISPLVRRLLGFEGELALLSVQRDRKKYRTTVLSLMVSIVLFVAFNALMLYTNTTQRMASNAMNYDLIIDLDYRQTHASQFAEQVNQLPDVQQVAYRRCTYEQYITPRSGITDAAFEAFQELEIPTTVEDGAYQFVLQVCAVGPSEFTYYTSQLGLDQQQFADPSAPQGILINHANLRQNGKLYDFDLFTLKPGDAITVSAPPSGDKAATSLTWMVGAVAQDAPLSLMGMGPTMVADVIVSDAVFDALSDQMLELGPINPGAMYVQSDEPDAATEAIKQLYKGTVGGNISYFSMAEMNEANNLKGTLITLFFYGFLALVTLIGVTNIINTLDTNIKLRRREIAMLKSVGLTPSGLQRILRYESLFYGLTALVLGLPLAIAVSVFIYYRFDGVSTFGFTLPWGAILLCIVGTLAIVFATMMISGAMLRNDNIVDTIKDENL